MIKIRILLIVLMSIVSGSVMSQVELKDEVTAILEEFCLENYDNYFYPRQYVVGTLRVTSIDVDEVNDRMNVKGTHTCRGRHVPIKGRKTFYDLDFKAELILLREGGGLRIRFWSWFERKFSRRDGYWEGPCERTVYVRF